MIRYAHIVPVFVVVLFCTSMLFFVIHLHGSDLTPQTQLCSTCITEIFLDSTCEGDGGIGNESRSRLRVCVQRVRSSGGTGATGVGRCLAGPHFLRPHHAGRPGRELAGHPCHHQTPADEDRHQLLHR